MNSRLIAELDLLYRNSPNGVAVLDQQDLYVRVNDALADFHFVSPEKLTGHSPWEFLCDDGPFRNRQFASSTLVLGSSFIGASAL
jgi:PAS domain-containing protein